MATYYLPRDDDPVAHWVARLNYLGQLCDEQAGYEGIFEPAPGSPHPSSSELRRLMAEWRRLAATSAFPSKQPSLL